MRATSLLARDDWDAIVIGAGVGGLVAAALLATRAGKRVLVLERHYEPGGLTQTFRRRRFAWDVGVHYLGGLAEGAMMHRIFEAASGARLRWARLPVLHDRLLAPGLDARFGGDRAALRAQLAMHAKGEERAIDRVLTEIDACARAAPSYFRARASADAGDTSRSALSPWADVTSAAVLADAGCTPRLTALLTYTWTNYGVPKERSSFAALALATAHYYGGAFYPVGGGGEIAHAIAETIVLHRGAVVVRADVDEILIDAGRARGVRLADGLEILAPVVISDAGARATFEQLVRAPTELRETVRAIGPSDAHVGLYVGLTKPPSALGLDGANLWIHRDAIGDRARDAGEWARGEREDPPDLFVSTACATDPTFAARYPGRSAITAAVAVPSGSFAAWTETSRGDRGDAYEARKDALGRGMLRLLARHLPMDAVEHVEVSTPLSTRDFSGHRDGEVYGLAATPGKFQSGPHARTPIAGLFLAGQDVSMCGIGGAAFGGLLAAGAVTRRDLTRELLVRW